MIRRRTSEAGGGVLSFTFLDVLTCTMGSLVLLLVVLAQKATNVTLEEALANANKPQAKAAADKPEASAVDGETPSPAVIAEIKKLAGEDPDGDAKVKLDETLAKVDDGLTAEEFAKRLAEIREHKLKMEKLREEAAQRVKDDEARVSHLEEHERRLEQEVAKLRVALERLEEAEKKQSVDQEAAKEDLERLQALVAETIKQIEDLRKETTTKKSYAIVPYKGANGTMRRPIYIECTKDAVTIYPEGIKLVAADFDGPLRSGNPLNAAIRAAREELNARATAAGQTDLPDPYPLLIVRPDGAYAYGAAMSAISSWDSDFGYEFVDADWKLEYPDPDPRLDQIMRHAVEQARQRQAMLAKAAPRRYGPRLAVGSGEGGGLGGGDADGAGFEGVVHPGGSGDRIGDHNGENWMDASSGAKGTGSSPGMGSGTENVQAGVNRYAAAGMTTDGRGGTGGSGNDAVGGNFADASSAAAVAATTTSQTAGGASQAGKVGEQAAPGGGASGQVAATGTQPGQGAPGGTQAAGSTERTGGSTFAGAQQPIGAAASSQSAATGGSPSSSGGSTGSPADASSGGQAGGSSSAAGGSGASGGAVSYTAGQTASAATSRGANWANEAASRRASAISRPIRVVVNPEKVDVMPTNQGGSGPVGEPTAISFHQPTDRVLDQLAAAVKDRMNEWGLAGHNMYWRPTLVLQVSPGAEQHAIRLNDLLQDSGIDVKFQEVASRTEEGAGSGTTR